ncbi:MAG: T9SS type A sorting domain-containing protein [Calditrichaeota bacterium]|nr:T9SS type A sorting domain-containing protein [Calditrichota bacterium]
MKRWFLFALLIASLSVAMAKSGAGPDDVWHGRVQHSLDTQWGPDTYGYTAKDSNEPDGPTFAWIDITEDGTMVTDLSDDNVVGVFPIGWTFHYYWYDVTQFWVGSNGYIKFSTAGQLSQTFPTIPASSLPNDVVAPYIGDWYFGGADPSECYYWSNDVDTLIVSWVNVTAWAQGGNVGNHNFQLILSGVDSSITFQYGTSTTGDVSNNDIKIGIENVTGQLGILNYSAVYPANSSAIKFYYPETVTYVAHDLGISGLQNQPSQGIFLLNGDTLNAWMQIRNYGNQTESSYTANFAVRSVSNTLITSGHYDGSTIAPAEAQSTTFPELWIPSVDGLYKMVGTDTLTGDIYSGNNSITSELHVVTLPGELAYDDGASDRDWGWAGGEGGMAMQFVPPVYPCEIVNASAYCTVVGPFEIQIIDDNGPGGSPGDVIWSQEVATPITGWNVVLPDSAEVVIEEGSFYVAWYTTNGSAANFGMDTTSSQGISRRSWEAAGGWAENRLLNEADVMVRATVRIPGQVNHPPVITGATPNPDSLDFVLFNTTIPFAVLAEDPDGQQLHYQWYHNGSPRGNDEATYSHRFITLHANTIKCVVCDFEFCDSIEWNIAVELTNLNDLPGLPEDFAIEAYPNPFNPQSTINFALPQQSDVRIAIFNLAGQEVTVLQDGPLTAGVHSVQWNASDMATGTYFAVLRAPGAERITKLLLLK